MAEKWVTASLHDLVEAHVSDYESPSDALYEYIKNLEDAGASTIHIDFDYKKDHILVYGDGQGMTSHELDAIRVSIGKSSKGSSHHGLGILAFMRFAQEMFIFSHVVNAGGGVTNVLSCRGDDDEIVSDIGKARPIGPDEACYASVYNKLNRWPTGGTICLIKGVGKYKSHKFDWRFKMDEEFSEKKFEKWLQSKATFALKERSYFTKFGEEKYHKVAAKIGHGTRVNFTVPSPDHPLKDVPGGKNIFEFNNRYFELTVEFDFFLSPSNDGVIRISEKGQNSLLIRDAFRNSNKVNYDSIYKHSDFTRLLTGHINFKIKPCDGEDSINVYSGSRSSLMVEGGFGNVLANILMYGDRSVIRPKIMEKQTSSRSRRDENDSRILQASMEAFFRDRKEVVAPLITTHSMDAVPVSFVKCPQCKLTVHPQHVKGDYKITKGFIYQPDGKPIYICGSCGNKWERRTYTTSDHPHASHENPQYRHPEPGKPSAERQKRHGIGYTFVVTPFSRGDDRRYAVVESTVKINRDHKNYQDVEKSHDRNTLLLYWHNTAIDAVLKDTPKEKYQKSCEDMRAEMFSWFCSERKRITLAEAAEAREDDVQEEEKVNGAAALADRWGAKVKVTA